MYELGLTPIGCFFFHFHMLARGETSVSQVQSGNSVQSADVQTESRTHGVFGRGISRSTPAVFWTQFWKQIYLFLKKIVCFHLM